MGTTGVLASSSAGGPASCSFTVTVADQEVPSVVITQPASDQTGLPSLGYPITVKHTAQDNCGISYEVLKLSGCTILDGRTYGDRDGLLSDEYVQVNKYKLCQSMTACGFLALQYPTLRVEAVDAKGNAGGAQRIIRKYLLKTEVCQ